MAQYDTELAAFFTQFQTDNAAGTNGGSLDPTNFSTTGKYTEAAVLEAVWQFLDAMGDNANFARSSVIAVIKAKSNDIMYEALNKVN